MALKTMEGSRAVAEAVRNCEPDVVACYPITPSTHVAEQLAKYYADGELKSYIAPEAEFSVMSILVGASATGARTFTTTSGQGLLYMHEVLFNASGNRLPIVALVANRAVSAPLSIWNDQQDSISQRDTGWIQIYCESNQEAVDAMPQAYKVAEKLMLPAMVCIDGHYLTHAVEQLEIPDKEKIQKYLPKFRPAAKLDPQNPLTMGAYANPSYYQEFREDLMKDIDSGKDELAKAGEEYGRMFGRSYGLTESYMCGDAEFVILSMGSVVGNVKAVVDELRGKGEKAGCLKIRVFRPFPKAEVRKALAGKVIGVFEKDISPGGPAPVYAEVLDAVHKANCTVSSFIGGLGGRDITREDVRKMFETIKTREPTRQWVHRNNWTP
ncbi:MAG: pyruvate ferredoxin oxidoreductase [Candidatus Micrarchaeota archaeon]